MLRFVRGVFAADSETTIGAAFLTKTISADGYDAKLEIWDTAGQERYKSLAPMYYRGAQAAVVVFDVTSRQSFEGAKNWVKELQRRAEPGMVVALAGNKVDLVKDRKVDTEEAADYARSQNLLYMETSAKGDNNVEKLFVEVAKRVPKTGAAVRKDVVNVAKAAAPQAADKKGCC